MENAISVYNMTFDTNKTDLDNVTLIDDINVRDLIALLYGPAIDIIIRAFTPLWLLIGCPGNVLALLVWSRPNMRLSSGRFLAALALIDLLFLVLRLVFEIQETWGLVTVERPFLCQAFTIVYLTVQYLSTLLVLGVTVERYIAVCCPFQFHSCTAGPATRALYVIICLTVFTFSLHAVQGYFWQFDHETSTCHLRPAVVLGGMTSFWSIWSWVTELLVFGLVPVAILILNVLVIVEIRRVSRRATIRRPSSVVSSSRESSTRSHLSRQRSANARSATTLTLLVVSFYLIAVTLPVTLCYVLHIVFPEGSRELTLEQVGADPVWRTYFTYWTVRTVVQEVAMSHYACNFFIYLATGRMFRQELQRLLTCLIVRKRIRGMNGVRYNRTEIHQLDKRPTSASAAVPAAADGRPTEKSLDEDAINVGAGANN